MKTISETQFALQNYGSQKPLNQAIKEAGSTIYSDEKGLDGEYACCHKLLQINSCLC
jgi:hypothetical protein